MRHNKSLSGCASVDVAFSRVRGCTTVWKRTFCSDTGMPAHTRERVNCTQTGWYVTIMGIFVERGGCSVHFSQTACEVQSTRRGTDLDRQPARGRSTTESSTSQLNL
jgi:hypothetical protein